MADAIATVVSVDRELYTVEVVSRLQSPETELRVSQHWRQTKALPLPALMVKLGGEQALARTNQFTYGLISPWPINKANAPSTPGEKRGMDALIAGRASVFYEEEQLPDGRRWLTALYPDLAVGHACRDCHNMHPDSPRKDFKEGEVWGALRVRVLM